MGLKSQFQIRMKQRQKRKKMRKRLSARGKEPKDYLYGKFYIKLGAKS